MKKIVSTLLSATMILLQFNSALAIGHETDFPYEQDFNNTQIVDSTWEFTGKHGYSDDGEGGKKLELYPQKASGYNTRYRFDDPVESGVMKISYSMKAGDSARHVMYVISSDNKQYPIMSVIPPGTAVSGYVSDGYAECIITKEFVFNEWYDVVSYIDMNNNTARTYLSDRRGNTYASGERALDFRTKVDLPDIERVEFQGWYVAETKEQKSNCIDNLKIEYEPVSISMKTDYSGNVFGINEDEIIKVSIKNGDSVPQTKKFVWEVFSDDYGMVDSGEEMITLDAGEEKKFELSPDIEKYGLYTLTAKLENSIINKKIDFAKILSSEDGEYNDYFHLGCHVFRYGAPVESVELMQKCGAAGWRLDFTWNYVESVKGQLKFGYSAWEEFKEISKKSPENLVILLTGNVHHVQRYDKNGAPLPKNYLYPPVTDEELKAWGEYCKFVAEETKGVVNRFEVWNEWDLPYTNTERLGAKEYIALLKTAYEAVKSVNPDATIVGLGGAGTGTDGTFDVEFIAEGGMEYSDAISFHTYDYHRGKRFPNSGVMGRIEKRLDIFKDAGIDKPVYTTEIGWPTAIWYSDPNHPIWSERDQALNLVKYTAVSLANDLNDEIYWYDFQEDGTNKKEREHTFGLVNAQYDADGAMIPKPAYVAAAAMNKFMTGKVEFVSAIEHEEWLTAAYNFKRPTGDNLAVIWSDEELKNISLKLGCDKVDMFDKFGNKIETVYSDDGVFDFGLSNELVYLIGNFTEFEEVEARLNQSASSIVGVKNDVIILGIEDAKKRNGELVFDYNEQYFTPSEENVRIENDRAEVRFKTSSNVEGKHTITTKLYSDSKCMYVLNSLINISEPVTATVNSFQSSEKMDSRWELEIAIENFSLENAISGVCRITEPLYIAEKCRDIEFKNIPAREIRKVYMNLPEMLKKRTVTIKGEVELDYGYIFEFEEHLDFTSARYVEKPPVIDGNLGTGEWQSAIVTADKYENIVTPNGNNEIWGGKDDLSIEAAKFLWDEDNFYLMAMVKDSISVTGDDIVNLWKYDSVQFAIEDGYNNMPGMPSYPFTEIGISLVGGIPKVYRYSSNYSNPIGEVTNCEVAIKQLEGKMIYELKIPWDELFYENYQLNPSWVFGFSMLANDNDSTDRWGWIQYNDGVGKTKDVTLFGKLKLYN